MTHHLHMRMLGHRVMRYAGITLGCLIEQRDQSISRSGAFAHGRCNWNCDDCLLSVRTADRFADVRL